MNKKELWLRLKAYHFDHIVAPGLWEYITARFGKTDASAKAFAGKIARKHGWKNSFAIRAIGEYKKFIYLGIISKFEVTPSKIIDVVWHEHLLFSKAYRNFCTDIIEQPFDHHPELLPMADQTGRYSAQYVDTIDLYKAEFAIEPPADIWGDTKFDEEQLNRDRYQSNKKKRNSNETDSGGYSDSIPLYNYFESDPATDFPEFTGFGEGELGGAGASSDYGDSSGDSGSDSGGDGGGCSGGGD